MLLLLTVALFAPGDAAALQAKTWLQSHAPLAGAELKRADVRLRRDRAIVRFSQTWRGKPVLDRDVTVTVRGGEITRVNGHATPIRRFHEATIDAAQARRLAAKAVHGHEAAAVGEVREVVLALGDLGTAGFEVQVPKVLGAVAVRIDAHAGRVVGVRDRVLR